MTGIMNINIGKSGEVYEFTNDWFSRNIPVWTQIVVPLNPSRILEIGSYEGRSATWLIENCKHPGGVEIHCVDPWSDYADLPGKKMAAIEGRFDKNIALAKKSNPAATVLKHKKFSSRAIAELIAGDKAGTFDLVYIDGSHRAADVLSDAVMSFHLLRIDGVMIFDDYLWHMEDVGSQHPLNMPKPAIDAFLNIFMQKMQIIGNKPLHQIYARKSAN